VEVTINDDCEQLGTPQVREDESWMGITEQIRGKPCVLSSDDDVEHNM
jgi:hypothetical protein